MISLIIAGLLLGVVSARVIRAERSLALCQAAHKGDTRAVARLLQAGADPNVRIDPGSVASHASFACTDYLLEQCIGRELHSVNRLTPLMWAELSKGHADIVRLLLQHGANPNITDRAGASPLFWAVDHNDFPSVRLLLNSGADPNAHWKDNTSVLEEARTPEIQASLIAAGARESFP